jgi:hypothetical protein
MSPPKSTMSPPPQPTPDPTARQRAPKNNASSGPTLSGPTPLKPLRTRSPEDNRRGTRHPTGGAGLSGVGLAEVRIRGVEPVETVRPPTDLLSRAGASSLDHRLTMLFSRLRSNPAEPVRADEEPALRRLMTLPPPGRSR